MIPALAFALLATAAGAREVALTFDDAPNPSTALDAAERTRRLIEGLRRAGVPRVAIFAIPGRAGVERLDAYARAGHAIGNHTWTHPELNTTSLADYASEIRAADRALRAREGFAPWFRFPFLREGETTGKRDGARAELDRLGLANGYVTINTYDWYMDVLFQKAHAEGRRIAYEILGATYARLIADAAEYYDRVARETLGRSPRHVLLLHENDLAALFVTDLIAELRRRGWAIVSPEDAYADPIATYRTANLFPKNPGRLGEIARDRGWTGDLWHESCSEAFLENAFVEAGVY